MPIFVVGARKLILCGKVSSLFVTPEKVALSAQKWVIKSLVSIFYDKRISALSFDCSYAVIPSEFVEKLFSALFSVTNKALENGFSKKRFLFHLIHRYSIFCGIFILFLQFFKIQSGSWMMKWSCGRSLRKKRFLNRNLKPGKRLSISFKLVLFFLIERNWIQKNKFMI